MYTIEKFYTEISAVFYCIIFEKFHSTDIIT